MRIGDLLYFAPGLRFDQVDLAGPGLPEQFKSRIAGLYLDPADRCAYDGFAFASGVILVSCIDALARYRFGGRVGKRFKRFVGNELPSFTAQLAARFYDEFRNGLVHEARLKEGGQFSLEINATVQSVGVFLIVNPARLAGELRTALDAYIALLHSSAAERANLEACLKADHAKDFLAAKK